MNSFYTPSPETLEVLNTRQWVVAYSGGKDSTSLVTWIEWLRRSGIIEHNEPRLVMSDTEVEYPFLTEVSEKFLALLRVAGWNVEIVRPRLKDKLYNSIFGRGLPPVHPSHKKRMRWCTQCTKVGPMGRYGKTLGDSVIMLTGIRWGESDTRDAKIAVSCTAGGECGLPSPGEGRYSPIITWKTCQVIDWLTGQVSKGVTKYLGELLGPMRELVEIYNVKVRHRGLGMTPPTVTSMRFGCIGCPAVSTDKVMERLIQDGPTARPLRRLYMLWDQLRDYQNRLWRMKSGKKKFGPVKMAVRRRLFEDLLKIQTDSGVTLVTPEDIAFIRQCWEDGVYPRGWSKEDEK